MAETRIYLVSSAQAAPRVTRLIRATNAPQALRHVVDTYFDVELASQDDCINLASEGVKVEDVGGGNE